MGETKRVLITGVTGQDGSYLAEKLVSEGHEVYGLVRRQANPSMDNLEAVVNDLEILSGDLTDQGSLDEAVRTKKPDEVYNLASQSHVGTSFTQPILTMDVTGTGVVRLLEAVRRHAPEARFYQASTSELFGACPKSPHRTPEPNENGSCLFEPVSPYAFAKLAAYHAVRTYREAYGLFSVNGILFNHESPRRGKDFVTRKITWHVAQRAAGRNVNLELGDVGATRDWGYAPEYVDAMVKMLRHDEPKDLVIGTGQGKRVSDFLAYALEAGGFTLDEDWVTTDPIHYRPLETWPLIADPSQAKQEIGWEADVKAKELARIMVSADLERLEALA